MRFIPGLRKLSKKSIKEALINCHLDRSGRLHGEGETGGREAGLGHGGGRVASGTAIELPRDLNPRHFSNIWKIQDSSASVGMTDMSENDKVPLSSRPQWRDLNPRNFSNTRK